MIVFGLKNTLQTGSLLYMNTTIEVLELRALTAVVEQGSFTAAADHLGTDKAHVSRIVSRLEKKLGAQLLLRSTRRISVTEFGHEIYQRATGILLALAETEASAARSRGVPTGTLKLTAGPEFGVLMVNAWIASYLNAYPQVRVAAEFTSRLTDIIHEGFDIAIRVGALPDSELSARKIGELEYGLFASPGLLAKIGKISSPADLPEHDLVMFSPRGAPQWKLVNGRDVCEVNANPRYQVNNNLSAMEMAVAGVGITLLPQFMAAKQVKGGGLQPLLAGWGIIPVPVHAVFAYSRYMVPKVRAFVDIAVKNFG